MPSWRRQRAVNWSCRLPTKTRRAERRCTVGASPAGRIATLVTIRGPGIAWRSRRLNLDRPYGDQPDAPNQIALFEQIGLVTVKKAKNDSQTWATLVDPTDSVHSIEDRARSYLHVNCAHCHRFGGGGTANVDLRRNLSLEDTRTVGLRPTQGTFNFFDPSIISAGDPFGSVLLYRMSKLGRGGCHISARKLLTSTALS